ncbi:MAG: hypothetical protein Q8J59_09165 [Methylotenera sp.]|nr:hypothetical protein [Methylotenera sp.]MDP2281840.1 hypothetical protein [Methylotenera sp.]MDP3059919.1 hypothetical protein [Methylotenera sp.]MDP3087592.1 hypothetical protein [Methylotenera sp.]
MRIQFISKQKPLICDEVDLERVKSLWQKNMHGYSNEAFTWIQAEKIDLMAEVYFEVITAKKLKVGIWKTTSARTNSHIEEVRHFNDLHWITVEDHATDQEGLISKLLLFIFGMVCVPNQIGCFMTDWTDIKMALQYGNEAKYISFNEFANHASSDQKKIVSSLMLLNEDLPFSKKLENATSLIEQSHVSQDYLSIMNITKSDQLSHTNMLLLVYKNLA